jgi:hypothetical protein
MHSQNSDQSYAQIIKELSEDANRTERQRQLERCYGKALTEVLSELRDKHNDNKSEMMREINQTLRNNAIESEVSRPTIYNWLEQIDD